MKVVEAFGPTIQGEGPFAGRACHFLRLGGCDYRCVWCDTMYAVDPEQVRAAENLNAWQIMDRLLDLEPAPMLVISGGNPALWDLAQLLPLLRKVYIVLTVETQGSRWRPWLVDVDSLVVSPKPPSSGMTTKAHDRLFVDFMAHAAGNPGTVLKVVVFDAEDLVWARELHQDFAGIPFYLSVGTEHEEDDPLPGISERYGWLCEQVAHERDLHDVVVLPQLHVIAWGNRVGV
jgi:7-carboxy-7-deazaguanine synthase